MIFLLNLRFQLHLLFTVLFILLLYPSVIKAQFHSCSREKNSDDRRLLFITTCETHSSSGALKRLNITLNPLVLDGASFVNSCSGRRWIEFLTKPTAYLAYINELLSDTAYPDKSQIYVILIDSDVFWSIDSLRTIWHKYDCARGVKDIVVSTEMSCWVGQFCNQSVIDHFYPNLSSTPSYSPFVNSGVIMGSAMKVKKMLEYMLDHKSSYKTVRFKRPIIFDDQLALTDYAMRVAPNEVSLDYHQHIASTFSIHTASIPPLVNMPFACKNTTGQIDFSCNICTKKFLRDGHFYMNKDTCTVTRRFTKTMPYLTEISTLAADPAIWHGNGAGKRIYTSYSQSVYECHIKRLYNMSVAQYEVTLG